MAEIAKADLEQPQQSEREIPAPELPYRPQDPKSYKPAIGLIGCGGISKEHLTAYKKAGYNVVALCDRELERAVARQEEFFPEAKVTADVNELFAQGDIEVVDITTHPAERAGLIERALRASTHVLSQKPFALDLDVAERLVDLAERQEVLLAVNQNGRWAPHFSYMRQAIAAGMLGEMSSVQCVVNWDHNWVADTPFDEIHHVILYDFAIHWFDILACLLPGKKPQQVSTSVTRASNQQAKPPLLAQAIVEYEDAQATLAFNGNVAYGPLDITYVAGSQGSMVSQGPDLKHQEVTLYTAEGWGRPHLEGCWFPDGFHGTMAELLCAIEEEREPSNSGRNNLQSLALCFAAVSSAEGHEAVQVGGVRRLPA